jgi:hypothetical protein
MQNYHGPLAIILSVVLLCRYFTSIFHVDISRRYFTSIFHVNISHRYFTSFSCIVLYRSDSSFSDVVLSQIQDNYSLRRQPLEHSSHILSDRSVALLGRPFVSFPAVILLRCGLSRRDCQRLERIVCTYDRDCSWGILYVIFYIVLCYHDHPRWFSCAVILGHCCISFSAVDICHDSFASLLCLVLSFHSLPWCNGTPRARVRCVTIIRPDHH